MTDGPGASYGVRLLELLKLTPVETHLIMGDGTHGSIAAETGRDPDSVRRLADRVYRPSNQGARVSSGSFVTEGMVVAPCSTSSLGAIAIGLASNLIHRAADVVLKEHRKLVLLVPDAPLTSIHEESVRRLAGLATVLHPPATATGTVHGLVTPSVDHVLRTVLQLFGLAHHIAGERREVGHVDIAGRAAAR